MFLNSYGLVIVDRHGNPLDYVKRDGASYVKGFHEQKFGIALHNQHKIRCRADVYVNGDLVGRWILDPRDRVIIERPADQDRGFTILDPEQPETGSALHGVSRADLGLVKVVFYPELQPKPRVVRHERPLTRAGWQAKNMESLGRYGPAFADAGAAESLGAAGVGLGDATGQQFSTGHINVDHSKPTTIMLRIVVEKRGEKYASTKPVSSPYPKPL